jgi:hypothetical protein
MFPPVTSNVKSQKNLIFSPLFYPFYTPFIFKKRIVLNPLGLASDGLTRSLLSQLAEAEPRSAELRPELCLAAGTRAAPIVPIATYGLWPGFDDRAVIHVQVVGTTPSPTFWRGCLDPPPPPPSRSSKPAYGLWLYAGQKPGRR